MPDDGSEADVITVSSYESVEVSVSSFEVEEIVLQESEYETVEEEIVVSDYVTDNSEEEGDGLAPRKPPHRPDETSLSKKAPRSSKKKDAPKKKSGKSVNEKAPSSSRADLPPSTAAPHRGHQDNQDISDNEEDPNSNSEEDDDDLDGSSNPKKKDKVWEMPVTPDSPTTDNNQKAVARIPWSTKDYYRGDSDCFNAWKKFRNKDYVEKVEREKKMKRIERREIVAKRIKTKERQVQTIRRKKPPKRIRIRRTHQIFRKKEKPEQEQIDDETVIHVKPEDESEAKATEKREEAKVKTKDKAQAKAKRADEEKAAKRAEKEAKKKADKEAKRVEEERVAKEKAEARRIEEENIAKEKAAEAKRLADEKKAKENAEADTKRLEKIRVAAEKAEAKRLEEERIAAKEAVAEARRLEEERIAVEKAATEAARLEKERVAAENAAAEAKKVEEKLAAAKKAAVEEAVKRKEKEKLAAAKAAAEEKRLEASREKEKETSMKEPFDTSSKNIQEIEVPPPNFPKIDVGPDDLKYACTSKVYTAITVRDCTSEPTLEEYRRLAKTTQKYYSRELRAMYGKAFVDLEVNVKKTAFGAGIPEPKYNIWINWDVKARFNKAEQKRKAVPTDDELLRDLVNSLSMEYIDDVTRLKKTPFGRTSGLYMEQVYD